MRRRALISSECRALPWRTRVDEAAQRVDGDVIGERSYYDEDREAKVFMILSGRLLITAL